MRRRWTMLTIEDKKNIISELVNGREYNSHFVSGQYRADDFEFWDFNVREEEEIVTYCLMKTYVNSNDEDEEEYIKWHLYTDDDNGEIGQMYSDAIDEDYDYTIEEWEEDYGYMLETDEKIIEILKKYSDNLSLREEVKL